MTFAQWAKSLKHGELAKLSRDTGVSYITLMRLKRGGHLQGFEMCHRLSKATDGAVSPEELAGVEVHDAGAA